MVKAANRSRRRNARRALQRVLGYDQPVRAASTPNEPREYTSRMSHVWSRMVEDGRTFGIRIFGDKGGGTRHILVMDRNGLYQWETCHRNELEYPKRQRTARKKVRKSTKKANKWEYSSREEKAIFTSRLESGSLDLYEPKELTRLLNRYRP